MQEAVGSEEPIFFGERSLAELSTSDLPEGVMLSVGEDKHGVIHTEWDGYFYKEGGQLMAECQHVWTRKYWDGPLGLAFYLDLVKRAIETRARTHNDVKLLGWDDDGAFINLSYRFRDLPDSLDEAYQEVCRRNKFLTERADSTTERIGIIASEAARDESGWGSTSIQELVTTVDNAKTTDEKGRSLEELIARLLETVNGFTISGRVRTETEEIDITVINASNDPRFQREEALILVECKNWSGKCGKNEFVIFKEKLENRKGRCSIGVLVSWNGFKETVTKEMLRGSHERMLIIPLDGRAVREAVRDGDFLLCLLKAWQDAITL